MAYSLGLDFIKPSTGIPESPLAKIYVRTTARDDEGHIHITVDCVSFVEFEAEIKRLHDDLEEIRKEAKRKFSK
jgi:hypothetical protein